MYTEQNAAPLVGNEFLKDTYSNAMQKQLERELGLVVVFTGGRGSGKTLSMTYFAVLEMVRGHKLWSNYKISFDFRFPHVGIRHLESIPLDMHSIYTFDKNLASGFVCIDELNLWASARRSMSVANRLINATMQLIRKRKLSFMITVQDFKWLDSQLRFQTDIWVTCRDQYHYRPHELKPGQFIAQRWHDMSGLSTGTPYTEYQTPQNVRQWNFWGQPFWNCYNSLEEFDVMEAAKKIQIRNETSVIDFRQGAAFEDPMNYMNKTEQVRHLLSVLKLNNSQERYDAREINDFFESNNLKIDKPHAGKIIKQCGWQYKRSRQGNFYYPPA